MHKYDRINLLVGVLIGAILLLLLANIVFK